MELQDWTKIGYSKKEAQDLVAHDNFKNKYFHAHGAYYAELFLIWSARTR